MIRLRMNPEPKKDGRKKMRLLVMGHTEPRDSSVKMMVALADANLGEEDEEHLSIGDVSTAYLKSYR